MKIDKQTQKKFISRIKELAINKGYKKNKNTIYKVENENIISVDFLIVNSEYLTYRINIKKLSFDDIFWKIMKMEENLKEGDALRVNGAFVAPTILIAKGRMDLLEDIDIIADNFLDIVNTEIINFLEKNEVIQYVLSNDEILDSKILQCLSYIDLQLLSKAKKVAEEQIVSGDKGRFVSMGKGFFELVLLYNN